MIAFLIPAYNEERTVETAVRRLREAHHVYMTDDSRINIAGLRMENIAYVARAVAQALGQ